MATVPGYLQLARSGELARRAREGAARLRSCDLCPRRCGTDRAAGETGECRVGSLAVVASFGAHHGEERELSGWAGSGTVFFSGCNLHCRFCQNWDISHEVDGVPLEATGLADVFLAVQELGCHNLNLVTPSHVVPQILAALDVAAEHGLAVPVVYNTSGYDAVATLALLDGVVDVYMPDLKTLDARFAREALTAEDYPERAREAIEEMRRQVGDLVTDGDGTAVRGLLVRHLVMPGMATDGAAVLEWLAVLSRDTFVNVMGQYRPCGDAAHGACGDALIRRPAAAELTAALEAARAAGLRRAGRH
jgi:putative pyruvate formate lyase activating enzyme